MRTIEPSRGSRHPRRTPRRILPLLALGMVLLPAAPAAAQAGAAEDEAAVLAVVHRLFDGMRARSAETVGSVMHPDARLVSTSSGPDGAPRVQVMPADGFVQAVGSGEEPWNEPIFDTEIRVDGHLAQVWTFYRFYAGERFSHCGHNAILLVRTGADWQIVHLADTRRTEGCSRG
jgi:hypothetical protein